jgi:hypothetical protein
VGAEVSAAAVDVVGRRFGDPAVLAGLATAVGLLFYGVMPVATATFSRPLGADPSDVGVRYPLLLEQSLTPFAVALPTFGIVIGAVLLFSGWTGSFVHSNPLLGCFAAIVAWASFVAALGDLIGRMWALALAAGGISRGPDRESDGVSCQLGRPLSLSCFSPSPTNPMPGPRSQIQGSLDARGSSKLRQWLGCRIRRARLASASGLRARAWLWT